MYETQRDLLAATLSVAVPMWVADLLEVRDAIADNRLFGVELQRRAIRCSAVIAHNGDALLHRQRGKVVSQGTGKEPVVIASTAEAFNRLAEGVACMAFCPGGVAAFGTRYSVVDGYLRMESVPESVPAKDCAPAASLPLFDTDLFTEFK